MQKKLSLFVGLLLAISINFHNLSAENLTLIPLKKPILTFGEIERILFKNILKPIKKPKITSDIKIIKKETTKTTKKIKISYKIPKKKPSITGIIKISNNKKSKYYSKKDYALAKKAISEMQKSKWSTALKTSKKAKDKSIHNFIRWKHLLTTGNQASFYDYKIFIEENNKYPRIDRLKYLAEHKLSTEKISPKK